MASNVQVKGLKELNDALAALPKNIGRNVLRGAVGAGAKVIRDEARSNASRGGPTAPDVITGQLVRAIYHTQVRELSSATRQVWKVGVRRGRNLAAGRTFGKQGSQTRTSSNSQDAYYAGFVEYGHWARRGADGRLTYVWRGHRRDRAAKARIVAAGVKTGEIKWIPGQPFMRPAWASKKAQALDAVVAYIRKRLPVEVAKARSRGRL